MSVLATSSGPILIGTISDGAGSATRAEVGASIACAVPIMMLTDHFERRQGLRELTREWFVDCIGEIQQHIGLSAAGDELPVHEYSCTVIVVVASMVGTVAVQIGDGAVVAKMQSWRWLTWPQHGEFANSTSFVTGEDAVASMQVVHCEEMAEEIALFSDGLENLLLQKADNKVFVPFFEKMLPAVRRSAADGIDEILSSALEDYLGSDPICARTDDDKSLILASRLG